MTLQELINMRTEFNELRTNFRKTMRELGKSVFAAAATTVFENNPNLQSFGWRQYTPYFNDGDTCTFNVYNDELTVNGEEDLGMWDHEQWSDPEYKWKPDYAEYGFESIEEIQKVAKDLHELMSSFEEEDYELMFGDHCTVTVNRDGSVDIEEYDHD